jgi:3'(2'), 5'-bisphosphate nucleotidase
MNPLTAGLRDAAHSHRLMAALDACRGAGAGLLALRDARCTATQHMHQLKTSVDAAAEGWILGYLESEFAGEPVLAEERHDAGELWSGAATYWTVDALDGTRSYVDGFDTWCVQVAWIEEGTVQVAVVHEPVRGAAYVAVRGHGAFLLRGGSAVPLRVSEEGWRHEPRFIDSTPPVGAVAASMQRHAGRFVECGSIGLKICRVAEGVADVFAKPLHFKLWDVAPGDLILHEAGGQVCTWDGGPMRYGRSATVLLQNILAAPRDAIAALAKDLEVAGSEGTRVE